jgi:HPt (histidine-containing phosphotransfer) domain-containing protein
MFILPLIPAAAILFGLGIYSLRFRNSPGALPFTIALFLSACYPVLYAIDLYSTYILEESIGKVLRDLGIERKQAMLIFRDFFATLPPQLNTLRGLLEKSDFAQARREIHRIKGAAACVRLDPFKDLTAALEDALERESRNEIEPCMKEIDIYAAALLHEFEEMNAVSRE